MPQTNRAIHLAVNGAKQNLAGANLIGKGANKRINVMTDIVLKAQEEILFLYTSDEALEAAAGAAKVHASFTLGSCTGLSECPGLPA